MSMPMLQRLIGAHSFERFFTDALETESFHSSKVLSPKEIDSLLSLDSLQGLYGRTPLLPSRFQVIRDGTVLGDPTLHPQGGLDPKFIAREYKNGSSLRINSVEDFLPTVGELCKSLAQECMCQVGANIYVTPPGNPGFDPHYDDHDVLILQCHGSKLWAIHDNYANKQTLPLPGFKFDKKEHIAGPATQEFELMAGDTFYIPRGHMHSAKTSVREHSVHITLALNWITWNELIFDMLASAAIEKIELRKSVLPAIFREGPASQVNESTLRPRILEILAKSIADVSATTSLGGLKENYLSRYFDRDLPGMFKPNSEGDRDA